MWLGQIGMDKKQGHYLEERMHLVCYGINAHKVTQVRGWEKKIIIKRRRVRSIVMRTQTVKSDRKTRRRAR